MNNPGKRRLIALLLLSGLFLVLAGCARTTVALDPMHPDGPVQAKAAIAVVTAAPIQTSAGVAVPVADQAVPAPAVGNGTFAFPADKGGQVLGQVLRPSDRLTAVPDAPPGPRQVVIPAGVARPDVPLTPSLATIVRPPDQKRRPLRPYMMTEGAPLSSERDQPVVPAQRELETGAAIALPTHNENRPAPLGYLGLPVPDRVPVDDATADGSVQAALSAAPPLRTEMVPFVPQNLPDPFQNAQVIRLRTPPAEEPTPPGTAHASRPPPEPTPPAK